MSNGPPFKPNIVMTGSISHPSTKPLTQRKALEVMNTAKCRRGPKNLPRSLLLSVLTSILLLNPRYSLSLLHPRSWRLLLSISNTAIVLEWSGHIALRMAEVVTVAIPSRKKAVFTHLTTTHTGVAAGHGILSICGVARAPGA